MRRRSPVFEGLAVLTVLPIVPVLSFGVTACEGGLDPYSLVKDLRVLGVRAEPPEVLIDAANQPDVGTVTFTPLVIAPAGVLTYHWSFCPVASDMACRDFDDKVARAAESFRDDLSMWRDTVVSFGEVVVDTAGREVVQVDLPPFTLDVAALSPAFPAYHVEDSVLGAGMGAWPSVVLTLTSGERSLVVQKRFVLGPADLSGLQFLAERFGYRVCAPGEVSQPESACLAIPERHANTNPRITGVLFAKGKDPRAPFEPEGTEITARPEKEIRLRPVIQPTEEEAEKYPVVRIDVQTSTLELVERQESVSISWFTGDGELKDALTWPKFTKSLDTLYTAPKKLPEPTSTATVWMVARDQRGGLDWRSVTIRIGE